SVKDVNGLTILAKDEHMRPGTTMQSLAQLNPSFVQLGEMGGFDAVAVQAHPELETINHVHHAGNSSGIVDGAAAVLIGSKQAGESAGLKPRMRIRAFANIGSEPAIMLTGPVDETNRWVAIISGGCGADAKDRDRRNSGAADRVLSERIRFRDLWTRKAEDRRCGWLDPVWREHHAHQSRLGLGATPLART